MTTFQPAKPKTSEWLVYVTRNVYLFSAVSSSCSNLFSILPTVVLWCIVPQSSWLCTSARHTSAHNQLVLVKYICYVGRPQISQSDIILNYMHLEVLVLNLEQSAELY